MQIDIVSKLVSERAFAGLSMVTTSFDRDSMARWYAKEHLKTDPGVVSVYYLPENAGDREIRLVEVNSLLGDRNDDVLEAIDFGVDRGTDSEHQLLVLDVTPEQWDRISKKKLVLPGNWTTQNAVSYANE